MPVSDQGTLTGHYCLIPRTLIFLTSGDQVLLLKGAAKKRLWAGKYNGIGGHMERGEDPISSARRELHEESGLWVEDLFLCGLITIDAGESAGILIFVLRGEAPSRQVYPSEEGTPEWHNIEEALSLPLVEDLPVILPVVLKKYRGETPFLANYQYSREGNLSIVLL